MQAIGSLLSQPLRETQDKDSQPYSTGLPAEWVRAAEAVFEQFAIHYGAARMASHWSGVNPDKAKTHWARVLMRMDRRSIGFALKHLPDMPPTIDEFCGIARRSPPPPRTQIEFKDSEADRQHRRDRIEAIKNSFTFTRATT